MLSPKRDDNSSEGLKDGLRDELGSLAMMVVNQNLEAADGTNGEY